MSHEQVREIAEAAAKAVVKEMGFDPEEAREIYADSLYIRRQRLGAEQFNSWVKKGAVGVFVSAGLFALWVGFKELMKAQ